MDGPLRIDAGAPAAGPGPRADHDAQPGAVCGPALFSALTSATRLPQLTPAQDGLLRLAFEELLRTGEPVPVSTLSDCCAPLRIDVARELERLAAAGRVGRGENGSVTGAFGLTIEQTDHELLIGSARWHTWCVIDALGILGGLGASGSIRSRVPGTRQVMEIRFAEGRPAGGDLNCVVFVPEYQHGTPVRRTWCPSVNFFPDTAAAQRWAAAVPVPGQAVPLAMAAAAATQHWRGRLRPC